MMGRENFNVKIFLDLLEKKQLGFTIDEEDHYLIELIATNDEAEYWYKVYTRQFPEPRLNLGRKRAVTTNYPIIIFALLLLGISVYGYFYLNKKAAPVQRIEQRFSGTSFKDIMEEAEKDYGVHIVFDEVNIQEMRASGVRAPDKISLVQFLDYLTQPTGLRYYKDPSGTIHISR
ncbi:DUF4974 domain-containing protein [Chitinophaga agrisoli]|uniref:DUF4974 domain-containing protein n=1 Tax=Chitinophaga agrisoli TaxID=2607653 RepID=A0A5B2VIA5_9BACT|nr:DUF4974 domain-containing protein [Chitinophaga agrisoli]KAA2238811.1 DUF4974 domain-containing protein [Chitinophaga agrisoli]